MGNDGCVSEFLQVQYGSYWGQSKVADRNRRSTKLEQNGQGKNLEHIFLRVHCLPNTVVVQV